MDFLRFFLPLRNPIGFGAADFIELILAVFLVVLVLASRPVLERYAGKLAQHTAWSMLLLALLPIALRLALLPQYPIPSPNVTDDFSYLLLADTLRHFHLANSPHRLHQFFETFFVLQEPTYSSIFPLGQGIILALGWTIFGHPWAGVALSIGAFCALCYWMLRAWTSPGWALAGGLLAVIQFGPLNQWMNSFWGGAVSACAGCLVFGALPRLREAQRSRDAVFLGLGLALQLLTRPYEFIFLLASVALFFIPSFRTLAKLTPTLLVLLSAVALVLLQNKQVTGSWTTLPYMLSQYQYGVPASFTVQPNPIAHRPLTREQQLDYEIQTQTHGPSTDTLRTFLDRFTSRVRFYRFFFLAPLYLALPAFLFTLRERQYVRVVITLLIFSVGSNFYPYFYTHYIAAVTCLFVLVSVTALDRLSRLNIRGIAVGQTAARLILFLCATHFVFWYGLHLSGSQPLYAAMTPYETWDAINHDDPDGRIAINKQLAQFAGKQLIFVRYYPPHEFREWVHNAANIDGSNIVWARDLGAEENEKLRRYYPDRNAWLLEPDFRPPRLTQYRLRP
jgi:hypothetical protein